MATDYPEHEKLKQVSDVSQKIGEFVEWLGEQELTICCHTDELHMDGDFFPVQKSIQALLAEYFEIDLNALENEKRAMLERMRESAA